MFAPVLFCGVTQEKRDIKQFNHESSGWSWGVEIHTVVHKRLHTGVHMMSSSSSSHRVIRRGTQSGTHRVMRRGTHRGYAHFGF